MVGKSIKRETVESFASKKSKVDQSVGSLESGAGADLQMIELSSMRRDGKDDEPPMHSKQNQVVLPTPVSMSARYSSIKESKRESDYYIVLVDSKDDKAP